MAPNHSPRFLKIVNEARARVTECTVDEVQARMNRGERFTIVDVREESEFARDHIPGAVHLGKGIIERGIEFVENELIAVRTFDGPEASSRWTFEPAGAGTRINGVGEGRHEQLLRLV